MPNKICKSFPASKISQVVFNDQLFDGLKFHGQILLSVRGAFADVTYNII